jgi:hypothetical protein
VISEGVHISPQARGWYHVPGLWNQDQVEKWKVSMSFSCSSDRFSQSQKSSTGLAEWPSLRNCGTWADRVTVPTTMETHQCPPQPLR